MSISVKVIDNDKLSEDILTQICQIKSAFGNYSLESQKKWIRKNLSENDKHFLVYDEFNLIAYSNLIDTSILLNKENRKVIGIGNVCTENKGFGYGKLLMKEINDFILKQNKIGFLLCKHDLISFYKKYCWNVIGESDSETDNKIFYMIYNQNSKLSDFEYLERKF